MVANFECKPVIVAVVCVVVSVLLMCARVRRPWWSGLLKRLGWARPHVAVTCSPSTPVVPPHLLSLSQSGHVFVLLSDIRYVSCDAHACSHGLSPSPGARWFRYPTSLHRAEKRFTQLTDNVYRVDVEAGCEYDGAVLYSVNVIPLQSFEEGLSGERDRAVWGGTVVNANVTWLGRCYRVVDCCSRTRRWH